MNVTGILQSLGLQDFRIKLRSGTRHQDLAYVPHCVVHSEVVGRGILLLRVSSGYTTWIKVPLPKKGREFIDAFDSGLEVTPIRIHAERPKGVFDMSNGMTD